MSKVIVLALYEQHSALESARDGLEDNKFAGMVVKGISYSEKAEAGTAILEACKSMTSPELQELGSYMGFATLLSFDGFNKQYQITLRGTLSYTVTLGTDIHGNITRLNNALVEIPKKLEYCREQLKTLYQQMETAKEQIDIPFEKEQELQTKSARLSELNIGGRSALDYLIKVWGMTLPEAVIQIQGQAAIMPPAPAKTQIPVEIKELLLPEKNVNNNRVIAYALLSPSYAVYDEPPKCGKDYNDYLKNVLRMRQPRDRE